MKAKKGASVIVPKGPSMQQRIVTKYAPPKYRVVFEVANGTGFAGGRRRFMDAIAMGIWPSAGLHLEGFEFKISRRDWFRELADPSKAAPFQKFLDKMWLVVPSTSVAKPEEVPEHWGLMCYHGDGIKIVKQASQREPEQMSRQFLAALLMRAAESSRFDPNTLEREKVFNEGVEHGAIMERNATSRMRDELALLTKRCGEFEKASGIAIDGARWSIGGNTLGLLGKNLRALLGGEITERQLDIMRQRAQHLRSSFDLLEKELGEAAKELEELLEPTKKEIDEDDD